MLLFACEVAVIVAWLAGLEVGGMYIAVVVDVPTESVPQFVDGVHVSVQVTPLFVKSFCT